MTGKQNRTGVCTAYEFDSNTLMTGELAYKKHNLVHRIHLVPALCKNYDILNGLCSESCRDQTSLWQVQTRHRSLQR